jgi:Amt family ammonium transporter
MTLPGLSLYYAGMAPKKQSLMTIAMQAFSITCLVTLAWMFFGYSLTFSSGSPVIGDYKKFFLVNLQVYEGHSEAPTIPEPLFCAFQLGFAVITATLMIGATGDRMKFYSMLVIVLLWHLLVYCPIAHSNWHPEGFLYQAGVLDYAGGNVVHIVAGMSGLVSTFVIGKRYGFDEDKFRPNNMLHTITGACFLWIGWFGFNAGSSFGANEQAAMALMMTQIATSAAAFSWILTEYAVTRVPTVLGMVNGAIAGLIAVTPAAGFVDSTGAFFIGLLSGPACYLGIRLKRYMGFDDALDAFGLHGIAGVYGGLMTGLFAKNFNAKGAFYGNPRQIGVQLYGIIVSVGWSLFMTFLILLVVKATLGIRVSVDTEKSGLDRAIHGEGLYHEKRTTSPSDRVAELLRAYAEAKGKLSVHGTSAHGASEGTAGRPGGLAALPQSALTTRGRSSESEDSDLTSSDVGEWV